MQLNVTPRVFRAACVKAFALSGLASLMVGVGSAYAAVPAAVTDAISDVSADAITVATAMIGVIAGLLVFSYIRKQLK